MILGALLDAGLALDTLNAELKKLNVSGFEIVAQKVERQGIAAVHVEVKTEETHAHRHLHHIVAILDQSSLDQKIKEKSKAIFTRLAEAEAAVHNTTVERIHFHEVGALDAIVDIVGAVAGLHALGVEKIYVSPFSFGTGFTVCAHGKIPVPVPATVALLKGKPVRYTDIEAELVTPTGAAILSTLGDHFGQPPAMQFDMIGYGAGTRELPIPNVLRLQLGELAAETLYDTDTITIIEANIDDMNPQFYEYVFDQLYAAGSLEVYTTPVIMKKSRPGNVLTVLASIDLRQKIIDVILKETTTIGVRWQEVQRAKAQREIQTVNTAFGQVRVKISRLGTEIINITPEYDDCKQAAREHPGVPLKYIYQAALEQGQREIK
ncbi:UPF0272 protein CHY_1283 [Candidatus Vecturithrix granuli]|uniref:Putative nickel insertion protein n=1 Tax=Vecturithrix granuli TaxID=1499967 RepID=A0A081C3H6_VECG1|nr:UPF0272 protein CHY_1283 [Candidatus Vecturithrix granuli]